ncbi:MAG TPA: Ig-like domain repeat protein, partial [Casimicrobiaceae bacterium]|nr:Ig-like domain repeat protein [Casimicrobiaceae bacterium]
DSVAAYYNEVSYGQQLLNITVACSTTVPAGCASNTSVGGWLLSGSSTPASCDFTTMGNLADQAATAAGYNIANYNNRFYVIPYNGACGWAGLAYIGAPYQAWSNGYNALWVYGHELGHNFTLWHAGGVNCSPQVLGGTCSVSEYGDRFDIMGNNSLAGQQMHFNAAQKAALNWIPGSSVKTHSSGTVTYTLSPLESPGQSTYAVKIPVAADTNRTYWIEYRQPIGFDSGLAFYPNNGAQIRVASPFDYPCSGCGGDDTELLDMTPGSSGGFYDATLVAGQTYTDSSYGVNVTVNSATASALTVTVAMSGGTATTTTLASSVNPSVVGASVSFTATVTGSAPTGTVAFSDGATTISGCSAVALPAGSANSKTATCSISSLSAGSHSIVASYSGDATNNSSASSVLAQVVKASSTTALASSLNPSTVGRSVSFTATVTGSVPTGTVAFSDGGTTISGCSAVALPAGSANSKTATCSTSSLSAGSHSIVASYSGDAANSASTSATLSQVVNNLTVSTTSIASSLNPSTVGTSVSFTATVTGSAPTGTVAFSDGGTTISGCSAVALPAGSANSKTATCSTSSLSAGSHSIVASYSGDAANNASTSATLSQVVNGPNAAMPGAATVVGNPYGALNVQSGTLNGSTLSNLQNNAVIQLGNTPGGNGSFAELDFQGFNLATGYTLTIQSGAPGQTVVLSDVGGTMSAIGGSLQTQGGNGAPPPMLQFGNPSGITISPTGTISAPSGLTLDTFASNSVAGQPLVNQGAVDGGGGLSLLAPSLNGSGAYRGDSILIGTSGNANNPVNGAHFLSNGLQLYPSTGTDVTLTLNDYGQAPQVINLMVNGNASVQMPSAWPTGSSLPPNNLPILPPNSRPTGAAEPAYGGGSIIVQATGNMSLSGGASNDFVFPGGIVLKASGTLDLNGVVLNQGWTTTGKTFQGVYLESPNIVSSAGNIQVYSNNLNWINFSTLPHAPVMTWTLTQQSDGSASYVSADSFAPHLNTYSTLINAAAAGQCWVCLVNTQPVNMH